MVIKKGEGRGFVRASDSIKDPDIKAAAKKIEADIAQIKKKLKRTYEIDGLLTKELKILAAIDGITINELVETAILDYVKKNRVRIAKKSRE